jgi:hypothetical protein
MSSLHGAGLVLLFACTPLACTTANRAFALDGGDDIGTAVDGGPIGDSVASEDSGIPDSGTPAKRLWPLTVGNKWVYVASVGTVEYTSTWTVTDRVPASQIIPSQSGELWELKIETTHPSSKGATFQYWQDLGARIVLHREVAPEGQTKTYVPPVTVVDEAWREQGAGKEWTESAQLTVAAADGKNPRTAELTRYFTLLAAEGVTVPAGSFPTVHFRYYDDSKALDYIQPLELWLAPGIGRVKVAVYTDANADVPVGGATLTRVSLQ